MSKVELIRRRNNHTARDKEVPDLPKVELFPRRNSAVFLAPDCLSKVELFLRRNSTAVSFSSSSAAYFFISRRGCDTGVTRV